MRRFLYLLPLVALLLLGAALALGLSRDPHAPPPSAVGRAMPDFSLKALAGPALSRASILGHPAVINVFASWCGYCRAEHPALADLARDSGVPVYGIAWRDKPQDTAGYLAELGDPYRAVGEDIDGKAAIAWGITGAPETFVVDSAGIIRYHLAGPMLDGEAANEILPLLRTLK